MPLKERDKFLFKRHLPMMLLLLINVPNHIFGIGWADAERRITRLPPESPFFRKGVMHPLGRQRLPFSNRLCRRGVAIQGDQAVKMVFRASDSHGEAELRPGDSGHIIVQPSSPLRPNVRRSFFGAENDVDEKIRVGVAHAHSFQSPRWGSKTKK